MAIIMQYGAQSSANTGKENPIIASGTISDGTPVTLDMDAGRTYELATVEYNPSTGAFRGMHKWIIATPEAALFGTTAVSRVSEAASTNSGVTVNWNADSSITLSQSTYAVRYILRDFGIN